MDKKVKRKNFLKIFPPEAANPFLYQGGKIFFYCLL